MPVENAYQIYLFIVTINGLCKEKQRRKRRQLLTPVNPRANADMDCIKRSLQTLTVTLE